MATFVRCIEGHAFDMTASETCPTCGSTVWKKEPVKETVDENKPPRDLTKAKQLAVHIVAIIVGGALIVHLAYNIWTSNFVKSIIQYVWELSAPLPPPKKLPPSRPLPPPKELSPSGPVPPPKEIPNPFASPEPKNPFEKRPGR